MTEEELAGAAAAAVARIGRQFGAEGVPEGADPAGLLARLRRCGWRARSS
jgi:hypothetical protein